MLDGEDVYIYCVKDVCKMLRISQSTLFRIRKKAGLSKGFAKRKTRYSLKEIEQLADIIKNNNCDHYENS
jgi:hypothetical protein